MPYHIRHVGSVYQVVKDGSNGKIMGQHKSKKEAQAQLYALYVNEKKK